jgi:hypothetical protein
LPPDCRSPWRSEQADPGSSRSRNGRKRGVSRRPRQAGASKQFGEEMRSFGDEQVDRPLVRTASRFPAGIGIA